VTDPNGVPLAVALSPGQRHESVCCRDVLEGVRLPKAGAGRPRTKPRTLVADKGYNTEAVRGYLAGRRIRAVIPRFKTQPPDPGFDRETYRRRNAIERCVGWLKNCRRVATRHEKLAVRFLAMAKLAIIRRLLRLLDPSNRT
jgi:transposase